MRAALITVLMLCMSLIAGNGHAQSRFEGTWSTTTTLNDDPGWYAEDYFCFFGCTLAEYELLRALVEDPVNDDRPLNALRGQAAARGAVEFRSLLTAPARQAYAQSTPEDQLNEICLRYGHFGMAVSVMPLRITDAGDHLIFDYETHDTRRIIHMRDSAPPPPAQPSRLGYSLAHYEAGDLIIETSAVQSAPFFVSMAQGLRHSDRLRTIERYMLSDDDRTLDMIFTVEDPEVLKSPWVWVKKWRRAPQLELRHHEYDCSFVPGQR